MAFGKSDSEPKAHSITAIGRSDVKVDAFLGHGSKVVGTLTFSGPVELDGDVEGEVIARDKLVIGEGANIKAKVSGTEILVRGTVQGDIHASKSLSLKKPARVTGNISSERLSIEEGVIFEGKCSMNGTLSSTKDTSPKAAVA